MAKYDGLIIPRSYNEYINKTDPVAMSQALQLSGVMDAAPTENSVKPAKSGGIYTALAGKQPTLTFDNVPTENSNNPVKSGGIYDALETLKTKSVPLGSIVAYYGSIAPANKNWLICDGRDTTGTDEELETNYPSLYTFLGGSNVLPDLRECVPVGIGQNGTDTIATHDTYTLGQFKDDQLQKHNHGLYNENATSRDNGYNTTYGKGYTGNAYTHQSYTQGRLGDTTHGKQKGVNWIIKATSGADTYSPPSAEIAEIESYFDEGLNKTQSYSTTEQKTGGTWIDGKPIYRKVIDFGVLPNATDKTVAHNISNIDKIISVSGWTSNSLQTSPLPFANPAGLTYQMMLIANTTSVMVRTATDRREYTTTYITLEYTKTTD